MNNEVECTVCGYKFILESAFKGRLGWHTKCPDCKVVFSIDVIVDDYGNLEVI